MVLTLHIIVCIILVILVLLQSGKEGMGVIFGGGSSSLFGSTGAGGILVKLTTFVAAIFIATSLGYNMLTAVKTTKESTIIDLSVDDPSAPVKPAPPVETAPPAGSQPAAEPAAPATQPATPGAPAAPGAPAVPAAPAAPASPQSPPAR